MKASVLVLVFITVLSQAHALSISEVMSNPTGDDGGREWIELYNNGTLDIDLSALTISTKSGIFVPVVPLSGGVVLVPGKYAIVGSTVAGVTKFSQDYGTYNGVLLKSGMSLVNTGTAFLEIQLNGVTLDRISSYTAAKEGTSYSLIGGVFAQGVPSPGEENVVVSTPQNDVVPTGTSPVGSQTTVTQSSPLLSDVVFFLPKEKMAVAGALSLFSVSSSNHEGSPVSNMAYTWSFGDGGEGRGASTTYRYLYPGRYVVKVEGGNGVVTGIATMLVRVVAPDISLTPIGIGKYGMYIDLDNPSSYDLDISQWKISIDGATFSFPKNMILAHGITRIAGVALGFASTTVSSSSIIKLLFPTMEEVTRLQQVITQEIVSSAQEESIQTKTLLNPKKVEILQQSKKTIQLKKEQTKELQRATSTQHALKKDVRIAAWIKSFFSSSR